MTAIRLYSLPGSYEGVVAYNVRTGLISVCDGPYRHQNIARAVEALNTKEES